ncbi:MAG: AbrB/MazE/SpoVT family DNA-binding domain-containing protein [Candidatus Aenigmarchaeota archaeon]|nr:AbrB/MazE/SpoVT family DNA-binding domain-containing protein [Candidatus Aenigmarchaeota archaeon]
MQIKRTVGEKGQVVLPKDIRDYIGIKPGTEVSFEVREREIIIRTAADPAKFVEDFCNLPKLKKRLTTREIKRIIDEQYEEELPHALHRR